MKKRDKEEFSYRFLQVLNFCLGWILALTAVGVVLVLFYWMFRILADWLK